MTAGVARLVSPALRRATLDDADLIFRWRNTPGIVALGKTKKTVTWQEHGDWLAHVLDSRDHLLLLILSDGRPVGQLRFDRMNAQACEVSIYLLDEETGRGLGSRALRDGCWEAFAALSVEEIVAIVRQNNSRSVAAFRKCDFDVEPPSLATEFCTLRLRKPPEVPHNRLTYGIEESREVLRTIESGHWSSGPRVAELEQRLARAAGVNHAVCVASGLSALRLALLGLGVQPGDRVLVPAYSCVALANAVLACGAHPVPVEVNVDSWDMSTTEAKEMLHDVRPAAAIAVNLFGLPAAIEQDWGIPVIEDCAHGFGMRVPPGQPLGSRAQAAILSFHATKLLGAGEGGAVVTDSDEVACVVRTWRDYSGQPPDGTRLNDRMTDLEAALALCQLNRLDEMLASRHRLAERYHQLLLDEEQASGAFRLPDIAGERVWYRYAVEMLRGSAGEAVAALARYGVCCAQPVDRWLPAGSGRFPIASRGYAQLISLPLYPTLSAPEQDRVVHAFTQVCRGI